MKQFYDEKKYSRREKMWRFTLGDVNVDFSIKKFTHADVDAEIGIMCKYLH